MFVLQCHGVKVSCHGEKMRHEVKTTMILIMSGFMVRLWMMIRFMMIRVYMMRLGVVDAVMAGQGAEAVKLRAVSMNFPKKSKVRPG